MQDFDNIKKRLGMSTTMPVGTGATAPVMMGSAHTHDSHTHDHSDEDDCDNTSPKGGCGCC